MNKSAKGALAAAAAGSLLLGGAGSYAFWTSSQDVGSAAINSGSLTLGTPDCTTAAGTHGWQLDGGAVYTPGTTKIVPGDTISKVCDMSLTLVGDHIGATLAMDTAGFTADGTTLAAELTPSASFLVDGAAYTPILDPGTHTVRATVSVTFNGAAATNGSENGSINLNAINVTATQTHSP
ncbi:MAG: alternate-type signal peptide protein [Marmoricola sp.]|nr:alternate-type signal peptide protein [Marmoricola sp.]